MTYDEFVNEYNEIAWQALQYSMQARREGLLVLEDKLNQEMLDKRDILHYGLSLVIDGIANEIIEEILSNIVNQEKDEYMAILKTIQKEAVLYIQGGINPRFLYYVLNSYTGIPFKEDEVLRKFEESLQREGMKNE
jgi:flagellar motor component MotA